MEPAAGLATRLAPRGDHYYFAFGVGDGAEDETTLLFDEMLRAEAARGDRRPLRVLVDIRAARETRPGSTRTVLRRHHEFDGRRVAVVGPAGLQATLVDLVIRATGHRDARYFSDEPAALAWLRDG